MHSFSSRIAQSKPHADPRLPDPLLTFALRTFHLLDTSYPFFETCARHRVTAKLRASLSVGRNGSESYLTRATPSNSAPREVAALHDQAILVIHP